MTQDESQQVEEALQAWRRWQQRQSFAEVRGMWYPGEDSSCREFRAKSNELRGRELDAEAEWQQRLDWTLEHLLPRNGAVL